jgi:hypothetical protein
MIFLTVASVASDERSFAKQELLKTTSRAAMSHDRRSEIGILSIETGGFSEINKQA